MDGWGCPPRLLYKPSWPPARQWGDLVLGGLTPIECLELYSLDLLLVMAFGHGLYRLTTWTVAHESPSSADPFELDAQEEEEPENAPEQK